VALETRILRDAGTNIPIDTLPRTRVSLESDCPLSERITRRRNRLSARDAQAACRFRCWASKRAPFFQRIKVIAAILRASVRRAIEGRIPLASNSW
jgi:hypothetical protein